MQADHRVRPGSASRGPAHRCSWSNGHERARVGVVPGEADRRVLVDEAEQAALEQVEVQRRLQSDHLPPRRVSLACQCSPIASKRAAASSIERTVAAGAAERAQRERLAVAARTQQRRGLGLDGGAGRRPRRGRRRGRARSRRRSTRTLPGRPRARPGRGRGRRGAAAAAGRPAPGRATRAAGDRVAASSSSRRASRSSPSRASVSAAISSARQFMSHSVSALATDAASTPARRGGSPRPSCPTTVRVSSVAADGMDMVVGGQAGRQRVVLLGEAARLRDPPQPQVDHGGVQEPQGSLAAVGELGRQRALAVGPPARLLEVADRGGAVRELAVGRTEQPAEPVALRDRERLLGLGRSGVRGVEIRARDERSCAYGGVGPALLERTLDPASRRSRASAGSPRWRGCHPR